MVLEDRELVHSKKLRYAIETASHAIPVDALRDDTNNVRHRAQKGKVLIPPLQTRSFRNPHNQKSQGFKSGERECHAPRKYLDDPDYRQLAVSSALTWCPM
ncbi:hypothetical protein TNCV_1478401 [Trichonephila clavipes]|nr:hypothetical protein TNCV_1478401 [Trichonephila clavipes]